MSNITTTQALSALGLGKPSARAFTVFLLSSTVLYALGKPEYAFEDDGSLKPLAIFAPPGHGVTTKHFLFLPTVVATAVYFFV